MNNLLLVVLMLASSVSIFAEVAKIGSKKKVDALKLEPKQLNVIQKLELYFAALKHRKILVLKTVGVAASFGAFAYFLIFNKSAVKNKQAKPDESQQDNNDQNAKVVDESSDLVETNSDVTQAPVDNDLSSEDGDTHSQVLDQEQQVSDPAEVVSEEPNLEDQDKLSNHEELPEEDSMQECADQDPSREPNKQSLVANTNQAEVDSEPESVAAAPNQEESPRVSPLQRVPQTPNSRQNSNPSSAASSPSTPALRDKIVCNQSPRKNIFLNSGSPRAMPVGGGLCLANPLLYSNGGLSVPSLLDKNAPTPEKIENSGLDPEQQRQVEEELKNQKNQINSMDEVLDGASGLNQEFQNSNSNAAVIDGSSSSSASVPTVAQFGYIKPNPFEQACKTGFKKLSNFVKGRMPKS